MDSAVSYKKLWKLLIDRDLKKNDLRKIPLSSSTLSKLNRNERVSLDVLIKICDRLQCEIGDIIELVPGKTPAKA